MIDLQLEYEQDKRQKLNTEWLNSVCNKIFFDNNHFKAMVTIILSNDERLWKLKKKYFHKDLLTDVICFNLEEKGNPIEGEIYISLDRVKENTIKFNQDMEIELRRVIIHGCLHLLGFDDQTNKDKKEMTRLEDYYLNQTTISKSA